MQEILIIRQPQNKKEYASMFNLRWKVLRQPWNQPKGSERDDEEANADHFIAVLHNKIIGTARLHLINENVAQIRYLAVEEEYRNKGVASKILEAIHLTAKNKFIKYLILNARETAVDYFQRNGYKIVGEGQTLFGEIKHKKMMIQFGRSDLRMRTIVENLKKSLLTGD